MGAFGVVVLQSGVEVGLQRLDALVEVFAHLDTEELVERGAVEVLDEAVGLGRSDPGTTMLDAVEVQVELVGVPLGTAELAPVVGEDGFDRQTAYRRTARLS